MIKDHNCCSATSHRPSRRVNRTKNPTKSRWGQLFLFSTSDEIFYWLLIVKSFSILWKFVSSDLINTALSYSEWINERGNERYWYPDILIKDTFAAILISWYPDILILILILTSWCIFAVRGSKLLFHFLKSPPSKIILLFDVVD